jgi:hypothetical protein
MARNIFIVDAYQVNGSGTFAHISGYPKIFDSESYSGDVDKALKRATGSFAEAWSGFCAVDNKQIQTVVLYDVHGARIDEKTLGDFPAEEPAEQAAE